MWRLEGSNQSSVAFQAFEQHVKRHHGSVGRALVTTFGWTYLACGAGSLVSAACGVFAPWVLHHLLTAFRQSELDTADLAWWLLAFFLSRVVNAVVLAQVDFTMEVTMMRLTMSLKALVFDKAMRRSMHSKTSSDDAVDVSNLYTSDMDNLLWGGAVVNSVWVCPLQIVVTVRMLYSILGVATFAGVAVILLSMVLNSLVTKAYTDAYEDTTTQGDTRMALIKEVFTAIQVIKLNAWETQFLAKIRRVRRAEMNAITRYMYFMALPIFLMWTTPVLVSIASFLTYTLVLGRTLDAATVFTALMLFNTLRDPLNVLPEAIQAIVQSQISIDRISRFMALDEVNPTRICHDKAKHAADTIIKLDNATFAHAAESAPIDQLADPVLQNVTLEVKKGELVVVHGVVGAGKSSLCAAILGELRKTSGSAFVRPLSVGYYSQQPWIQHMSIRDNILFGSQFDQRRYEQVLEACGLLPDLKQFSAGDATEIGQKGINLSGGQKARLCLARACYAD
ncbi:TPA: hypothetical protein N0F65_009721, partial [Lagenidium giganteum]